MTNVTLWRLVRLGKRVMVSLFLILFVMGCDDNALESVPPVEATPAAGGMVMPTAASDTAVEAPTPAQVATELLLIGDRVQVIVDEGLRLYSDAKEDAMVMSVYEPGAILTVLDPSGDYAIYPVDHAGRTWYRLRAPDGLVGWGAADQFAPTN
jgi:hypothetical protein